MKIKVKVDDYEDVPNGLFKDDNDDDDDDSGDDGFPQVTRTLQMTRVQTKEESSV